MTKLSEGSIPFSFKMILLTLGLLDDLLQQIDVIGEGLFAGSCQRAGRQRTIVLEGFRHRNISRFLEGPDMRGQVAIGHSERIAHFCE